MRIINSSLWGEFHLVKFPLDKSSMTTVYSKAYDKAITNTTKEPQTNEAYVTMAGRQYPQSGSKLLQGYFCISDG